MPLDLGIYPARIQILLDYPDTVDFLANPKKPYLARIRDQIQHAANHDELKVILDTSLVLNTEIKIYEIANTKFHDQPHVFPAQLTTLLACPSTVELLVDKKNHLLNKLLTAVSRAQEPTDL